MDEHEAFQRTIRECPDQDGPKLVYADWLEERGDSRGELIRLSVELNHLRRRMQFVPSRIAELSQHVDSEWLSAVFGHFRVILQGYPADQKLATIKAIRETAGLSLKESKDLSEALPAVVADGIPWPVVERVRKSFGGVAILRVEPSSGGRPLPAGAPFVAPAYRITLRSHINGAKLQVIRALRSVTDLGLAESKTIVESLPRVLRDGATIADVERYRDAFRPFAEIDAEPTESPR